MVCICKGTKGSPRSPELLTTDNALTQAWGDALLGKGTLSGKSLFGGEVISMS